MTTYRITAPSFSGEVTVASDEIQQADTTLDWAIGRSWPWLRDYCDRKGWVIQPLIERGHVVEIVYEDDTYEFFWRNNRVVRITRHRADEEPVDLTMEQLPKEVQEAVE